MNIVKIIKNEIELKRLKEEEMCLEGFFENRFEAIACLGDEYFEDDSEYEEVEKRYSEVIDKIEELEDINKRNYLKKILYLIRR